LLLATFGVLVVIGLYFVVPGFQPLDAGLLILVVAIAALGTTQNIIRGAMSVIFLYIATGMAALFYVSAAPYIGAPFGERLTNEIFALSFSVLTALVWLVLELIGRALVPDTSLPAIGILDQLGGLVIYLLIGLVVASLLFNAIGYGARWRAFHDAAQLRSTFSGLMYWILRSQSFWFAGEPPNIYAYDMG
jgi:hypothetical protein